MIHIRPRPLTRTLFTGFGYVVNSPPPNQRLPLRDLLRNDRISAEPALSLSSKSATSLPVQQTLMERHPFSSQAFFPRKVSRYLVVVAPDGPCGEPDVTRCEAFFAGADQGVIYHPNIWHCPLTVLDSDGQFVVFSFRDGLTDDVFHELADPISLF